MGPVAIKQRRRAVTKQGRVEMVMLSTRIPVAVAEGLRRVAFAKKVTRQVVVTEALKGALRRPWKGARTKGVMGWWGRRATDGRRARPR